MKKIILLSLISFSSYPQSAEEIARTSEALIYKAKQIEKAASNYLQYFDNDKVQNKSTDNLVHMCIGSLDAKRIGYGRGFQNNIYQGFDSNKNPAIIFSSIENNDRYSLDLREAEKSIEELNPKQHLLKVNGEILIMKKTDSGRSWRIFPFDGSVPKDSPATISMIKVEPSPSIRSTMLAHVRDAAKAKFKEVANDKNFKMNLPVSAACKALAVRLKDNDLSHTISQLTEISDKNQSISRSIRKEKYRVLTGAGNSGQESTNQK